MLMYIYIYIYVNIYIYIYIYISEHKTINNPINPILLYIRTHHS